MNLICLIRQDDLKNVATLTRDNFDNELKQKHLFVLFYGAGCRQCNKLAPEWKSLADTINKNKESDSKDRTNPEQEIITNENPGILIAKANCSIDTTFCNDPI